MSNKVTAKFLREQELTTNNKLASRFGGDRLDIKWLDKLKDLKWLDKLKDLGVASTKVDKLEEDNLSYHLDQAIRYHRDARPLGKELGKFHPDIQEFYASTTYMKVEDSILASVYNAETALKALGWRIFVQAEHGYGGISLDQVIDQNNKRIRRASLRKLTPEEQQRIDGAYLEWGTQLYNALRPLMELYDSRVQYRGKVSFSHVSRLSAELAARNATKEDAIAAFEELITKVDNSIYQVLKLILNPPALLSLTVELASLEAQANKVVIDRDTEYLELE